MQFRTGTVVSTPGALARFTPAELLQALGRHIAGDWGDLCDEDKEANNHTLGDGGRIFSSYELAAGKLWIITEADRSVTTFLLPEEY